MLRWWRPALLAAAALASPLAAQQRRSPTDDVIEAAKRALNDLRYDEAIRLGRDIEPFTAQMRTAQVVALRQVLALAFFPEEREFQRPDSALRQLVALVRLRPDADLAPDLRWSGLDSLLAVARERTFAAALVPVAEYQMGGAFTVATTRSARVRLVLVERGSGRVVARDSALVRGREALTLRAHDDREVAVRAGEHELRLAAFDVVTRDSVLVAVPVVATATSVSLLPLPVLDSTRLRVERERPDRARTAVKGLLFGVATAAIGSLARGGGRLARDFDPDPRAAGMGAVIALGSLGLALTEKGRAIPAAVRANDQVRAAHARALAAAQEENARRLAGYRVTLRVSGEAP